MATPRLFVQGDLTTDLTLFLPDSAFRHCIHVLRLGKGANIILFNGDGFNYSATINQLSRRDAQVTIVQRDRNQTESSFDLCLVQGVSKGDHMDFTIQKAVELGVQRIQPVFCHRSQRLPHERLNSRYRHWQAIAISACEQSGRSHLVQIDFPRELQEWLDNPAEGANRVMLDPKSKTAFDTAGFTSMGKLELLIGPEGGFTEDEVARAKTTGITTCHLGPRILRTETAAIVALSLAQARWGDLK